MQFLTMGANAPLDCDTVAVTLRWPMDIGMLDASIFMLGSDGRVRGDQDMIFYNQRSDPDRAVHISSIAADATEVMLDLTRAPNVIDRIVICVTVEQAEWTLARFVGISIDIDGGAIERIRFEPDLTQASEVAMRMVEVYRRNGRWRIRAIGQGFNAGLDALARSFGVDVSGGEDPTSEIVPPADPPQVPQAAEQSEPAPQAPAPDVEHRKSTSGAADGIEQPPIVPEVVDVPPLAPILSAGDNCLSAGRPEHVWTLSGSDDRVGLTIEMLWQSRLGGAHGRARYLELELGCFYEAVDGTRGILQTWDARGHIDRAPFIRLEDAKMVNGEGRQTLAIADKHLAKIKRLQLYAFIPEGSANWALASVAMRATLGDRAPVSMSIDKGDDGQAIVALMTIDQTREALVATHLAQFALRHPDLDALLGWGMSWKTRPSPYIR